MRLLLTLFIAFNSYASTVELVTEFLKNSSSIIQWRSQSNIKALGPNQVRAAKSWLVDLDSSYYRNELDGTILQTESTSYALTLSKKFLWGGQFSVSSGFGKYNTFPNSFMPQATSSYEFTQMVQYSQDLGKNFFGIDDRLEIDVAKDIAGQAEAQSILEIEAELLNFYQQVVGAQLNKGLHQLEKEAFRRANRRTEMVRRRVRDGLKEKVDLYQASMIELTRKESVESANVNQLASLQQISTMLHRKIGSDQIDSLKMQDTVVLPQGDWNKSLESALLKKNIELVESSMRRVDYSFIPKINLATSYKTNSHDPTKGDAFSNGTFGNDKAEFAVGVNVSMPLWFAPQRVEKQKLNIELQTAQAVFEKKKKSFEEDVDLIRNQIMLLNKNVESAKERVVLAKKVLKEYNKFYDLGRADLDQVLRSEEDLIATEKSYIAYIAEREKLVSFLAYKMGCLSNYLTKDRQ